MDNEKKLFDEKLNNAYDMRGRAKLAIYISMFLYPSFLILDLIYTPQFFKLFLIIRMVVVGLHVVLLLLYTRTKTNRGYVRLGEAMVIFDAVGIAIMIQVMGGFYTSYYQGLNIIVMGMIVVIPLAFRETLYLYVFTWALYAIPSIITIKRPEILATLGITTGNEWRFVFNNLFFLTSIIIVGAFGSYLMDSIRRRELRSRIRLEETTAMLQESNNKLKALDELKTQFFANVNHELRTPLTLMLTPLVPMIEGRLGPLTPEHKETLETVRRNGLQLLKLINNLLDLTKLEAGKMRLKIKPVEIIEYAGSFLETIKPLADRKNIHLYFQHPPHKVEITLDPDHFEKVIMNLLSNAVKFTPTDGRITIYIEDKPHSVILTVEDTGEGIPKNMLESIFDRFSQVDGSLSRTHEGTGIGLSLAREIVQLHGGKIHAESELGHGSRLVVKLLKGSAHFTDEVIDRRTADQPVALHKRASDQDQPRVQDIVVNSRDLQLADLERVELPPDMTEPEKKHEYQLLVIDDNPEVLKLMKLLLCDEFDLEFSTSASTGLQLMRDHAPDLVLCDVMMPGMDGQTFCRHVKNDDALKHTPVILVTARSGAEMLVEGIDSGADDYLPKPFNAIELKARIRALLRIRAVEAELALANRNLKMRTGDLVERQKSLFISMGQIPGLGYRSQGPVHSIPFHAGDGIHHENREKDGAQRTGTRGPRTGRHPSRRRQDRRSGMDSQQEGQTDRRGVLVHQEPSHPGGKHPQPRHRIEPDLENRPRPPRTLQREGISRRPEGPGDPARRAHHGRRRRL